MALGAIVGPGKKRAENCFGILKFVAFYSGFGAGFLETATWRGLAWGISILDEVGWELGI